MVSYTFFFLSLLLLILVIDLSMCKDWIGEKTLKDFCVEGWGRKLQVGKTQVTFEPLELKCSLCYIMPIMQIP